jgi:leucyl-tRNA synthetase
MKRYNPNEIEPKWQKIWEDQKVNQVEIDHSKNKMFVSGMFPYPSGVGMHTGHAFSYSIVDAIARFYRQHGYNVMTPMGWDTFGLPAENYAIKTGKSPAEATATNIAYFKKQFKRMGVSIDWSREINSSDPEYYRWTQWVFTKLFERGLAYQKESLQWWCPVDKTVLANEQVEGGHCWRCGTEVEKKSMKQWFFKITDYADALLDEIPDLDWPTKIKTAQINWIGKSQGAEIEFKVDYDGYFSYVMGINEKDISKELIIKILNKTSSGNFEVFIAREKIQEYEKWISKVLKPGFWNEYVGLETVFIFKSTDGSIERLQFDPDNSQRILNLCNKFAKAKFESVNKMLSDNNFYADKLQNITIFTTRPDTIFGSTFVVLAPEHPLAKQLAIGDFKELVEKYIAESIKKSEIERMSETREKTGVFTGSFAINPANGERVPIWIADYVLAGYGTGAVMAVPAHDERDFAFAEKFGLPIKEVILPHRIDENNPPRGDKVTVERQGIHGLVYDPKTDKYLCVQWKKFPWTAMVVGGMEPEDNGDVVAAARREIHEETGYKNLKFVKVLGNQVVSEYYAANKDINRKAYVNAVLFELINEERDERTEEEKSRQDPIWLSLSEITKERMTCSELDVWLDRLNSDQKIYDGEGLLTNSGVFNDMASSDAREEIVAWLEKQGTGRSKTTYKMRDWLISRQRYWGAPIPIVYCKEHGAVAIPEDQLPVLLPEIEDYAPKGDGKSALARAKDWLHTTCPICGGPAERETDTMDGYACSSWYLLRYADPHDNQQAWDPAVVNYWAPVDYYVGGDHAVAHLLYVRFWTHVFYEMGLTNFKEPIKKLIYHGYINAEDGTKMSKSKGNVIDPLDVINQGYGADALRTYVLFMGPIEFNAAWSSHGIAGVYRFLNRIWVLVQEYIDSNHEFIGNDELITRIQNKTARKVTEDFYRLSFNTAISALMEYTNELYKFKVEGFSDKVWLEALKTLVQLIAPFAPHMSDELWQQMGGKNLVQCNPWPVWDDNLVVSKTMTIVVQVNGKLRAKLDIAADTNESDIKKLALENDNVKIFVGKNKPSRVIYIPGRLVNIVIGS